VTSSILIKQTGMTKLLINFNKNKKTQFLARLFSNFSTFSGKPLGIVLLAFLLSSCSEWFEPTISEICNTQPNLCLDLSLDARCRFERAEIIRLRYNHKDDTSEAYKYPLLLAFEKYLVCVEEVQHIEHIRRKGKEATRLKGVITAQRELKRLARETKASLDPYLSYYHWTRFGDEQAFNRFERYAASQRISDPSLLVALASVQVKTDAKKTVATLYRALSLYDDSDDVDLAIYHSLYTLALDSEKYRMAYVWMAVAAEYDERMNLDQASYLKENHNLPVSILDKIVDDIVKALDEGSFNANKLLLDKL